MRLLGIQASSFSHAEGQLGLLDAEKHLRWRQALSAADHLRDKYGEATVSLGSGLKARFRERIHENPADLTSSKKDPE